MFEANKDESKALVRQKLLQLFALLLFSVLVSLVVPEAAKAGEGKDSGGGGGTAHDSYIAAGFRVLHFLEHTTRGQGIAANHKLDLCRLRATLDENLVFVYQDANGMRDHRGSIVDAYTYAWRTHIDKNKWEQYFAKKQDIYFLVFKEMLRAERTHFTKAIDISRELMPFPKELTLENPVVNLNSTVDLKCLKQEELKQIEEIKNSHILFAAEEAPRCVDANLLKRPEFLQQNTADKLLDLVKNSKCQVQPSGCRIADETEIVDGSVVLTNSIYWKNKRIYSVPVGTISLVGGQAKRNVISALSAKAVGKLRELEVEGVCGLAAKNGVEKIKNKINRGAVESGEKLSRKESSTYHGMIVSTLHSNSLNCKIESQNKETAQFISSNAATILRSANIKEASRVTNGDSVRVNLKFKLDRSQEIQVGQSGKKADLATVEVVGNAQSNTPERISIQIGIHTVLPTGGWANPSYAWAMITYKTIECQ